MTDERKPPSKAAVGGTLGLSAAIALAAPIVMQWEGKRNDPYLDIVNVRTVCYGHTGGDIQRRRYSDAECRSILAKDMEKHARPVFECVPVLIQRPYEAAASVSLAFNIGTGAFCRSTAARRFNAHDFKGGCKAIAMWNSAGGRVVQGLVNRRRDEVALCMRGTA